jgi:hypothetical protein
MRLRKEAVLSIPTYLFLIAVAVGFGFFIGCRVWNAV